MRSLFRWIAQPAVITFVGVTLVLAAIILHEGGDPLALARIGTRFDQGKADGTSGYDGQFVYYIAREPRPELVAIHLDVPAYRYQRILLPLFARWLAFGSKKALPWTLIVVGLLSHTLGTWAVSQLLQGWGVSQWYALIYAFYNGFMLALRLDLPEPLAYALVAGGFLALEGRRKWLGWALLGLALFAKEVTILFVAAYWLSSILRREWDGIMGATLIALAPFMIFQVWLWRTFGQVGMTSGGDMATSFEVIPFMGFLRIGFYSPIYLLAMSVVFVPAVIYPAVWGGWISVKKALSGDRSPIVLALFLNSLVMAFLPFSTYRETGGLVRFTCGLVLAVILFAARYRLRRVLNYSGLWTVLNVFLLKS